VLWNLNVNRMTYHTGLDRTRAADFITRHTEYRVALPTLISWERKGLLPRQWSGPSFDCTPWGLV
jgi:hypothetical protein